jgi:adenine-specific DNA methylase
VVKRFLRPVHPDLLKDEVTPKKTEAIQNLPHSQTPGQKDRKHFEDRIFESLEVGRREVSPAGVAVVVFAHASTEGWESLLNALLRAGWIITGSWPIDTEKEGRTLASRQRSLASSIHLICRPREKSDTSDEVGDWRDVLSELPRRIHEWMPRLAEEGVVGADAIFACLGPALEVFSRYSRVEKSSGETVPLSEYLVQVWAAVSKEALSMIFKDADTAGLEPDARLTAMWLWTLGGGASPAVSADDAGEDQADYEESGKVPKMIGFALEFDAARKIAQGLGVHLEKASSVVEIKGDTARLLSVAERTKHLFGKQEDDSAKVQKKKKEPKQQSLFAVLEAAEKSAGTASGKVSTPTPGATVLDQVHQAMILFAAGRGEAMKRFLVEDGVGKSAAFWKLAQSLSALYPPGGDEKRWVDGVLARKKGLGF